MVTLASPGPRAGPLAATSTRGAGRSICRLAWVRSSSMTFCTLVRFCWFTMAWTSWSLICSSLVSGGMRPACFSRSKKSFTSASLGGVTGSASTRVWMYCSSVCPFLAASALTMRSTAMRSRTSLRAWYI